MFAFLGRYHDQTPATQRKCKHSERACNFKQGQDLSQRFQSALALSRPAGMNPWNCSVYLQTDCGLCDDASLSPWDLLSGIFELNFSRDSHIKVFNHLSQCALLFVTCRYAAFYTHECVRNIQNSCVIECWYGRRQGRRSWCLKSEHKSKAYVD